MGNPIWKCISGGAFGILFLFLFCSCANRQPPTHEKLEYGQSVSGKVTFKGKPVPFGYVLMFHHEKSFDPKTNRIAPTGVAEIKNGSYTLQNVPIGPAGICVATDPDVHPSELVQAQQLDKKPDNPGSRPGGIPGGVPGLPPQPMGIPGVPPMAGMPPMGPPGPGMSPLPPPMNGKGPGIPPNGPGLPTANLSEDQRKILREIHDRYGSYAKSAIGCVVREGEQRFDINLK